MRSIPASIAIMPSAGLTASFVIFFRSRRVASVAEEFRSTSRLCDLQITNRAFWMIAFLFVLSYEMFMAALSLLGKTPWAGGTRWSIGLDAIAIISALGLLAVIRDFAPSKFLVQQPE